MNNAIHRFSDLFSQLGLPNDPESIANFLAGNHGMANGMRLPEVPYWNVAQAQFLSESLLQDADWTDWVDRLSQALQHRPYSPMAPGSEN
ncbi:DUF2789 family protein [Hydrogenophaga soli]|nr:DUF2789 family protein [Burkholderiaceae bacterium]